MKQTLLTHKDTFCMARADFPLLLEPPNIYGIQILQSSPSPHRHPKILVCKVHWTYLRRVRQKTLIISLSYIKSTLYLFGNLATLRGRNGTRHDELLFLSMYNPHTWFLSSIRKSVCTWLTYVSIPDFTQGQIDLSTYVSLRQYF